MIDNSINRQKQRFNPENNFSDFYEYDSILSMGFTDDQTPNDPYSQDNTSPWGTDNTDTGSILFSQQEESRPAFNNFHTPRTSTTTAMTNQQSVPLELSHPQTPEPISTTPQYEFDEDYRLKHNPARGGEITTYVVDPHIIEKEDKSPISLLSTSIENIKSRLSENERKPTTVFYKGSAIERCTTYLYKVNNYLNNETIYSMNGLDLEENMKKILDEFRAYVDERISVSAPEILDFIETRVAEMLPSPQAEEAARLTQKKQVARLKANALIDYETKEEEFLDNEPNSVIMKLSSVLRDNSKSFSKGDIQRYLDNEDVDGFNDILDIIKYEGSFSKEEAESRFRDALVIAREEDPGRIMHRIQQYSPELSEQLYKIYPGLSAEGTMIVNASLYVMLGSSDKWTSDYHNHKYTTFAESMVTTNAKTSNSSNDQLIAMYPSCFTGIESKEEIDKIASGIRLNAKRLTDLVERNKDVCSDIESVISGKSIAYNAYAGIVIPGLKICDIFGGNVEDYITDIDLAATLTNDLQDSKFARWFGNFTKNNMGDIIGLLALFATGPVGAAAKAVSATIGIVNDVDRLKDRYDSLKADKNNTNADVVCGMFEEIVMILAPIGIGQFFKRTIRLLKDAGAFDSLVPEKTTDAFVTVGTSKMKSTINSNREKNRKR